MTKTCNKCGREKPLEEFKKHKDYPEGRGPRCKVCTNSYYREYMARLGGKRLKQVAVNVKKHKQVRRKLVNELKQAPCTDCGKKYIPYVMDFDHVRGIKTSDIAKLVNRNCSLERLREEIAKCELVCANCHRIRTYRRRTGDVTIACLPD